MAGQCWRAAAQFPAPDFDDNALKAYVQVVGDPTPLIRSGLPMIGSPAWSLGLWGITSLFSLANPTHCFRVLPHAWARFHEPQVTAGFAYFLNSGPARCRVARALAFVKAAARCAGRNVSSIDAFDVQTARCVAEENRTDILVELRSGSRRVGAAIEAKFGHKLTRGQLPKALRHVRDCDWIVQDSVLLVVSPDAASLNPAIMRQNRNWHAASWWSLLSNLEQLTDPDHDCDDYRRFRRTVWRRAY